MSRPGPESIGLPEQAEREDGASSEALASASKKGCASRCVALSRYTPMRLFISDFSDRAIQYGNEGYIFVVKRRNVGGKQFFFFNVAEIEGVTCAF